MALARGMQRHCFSRNMWSRKFRYSFEVTTSMHDVKRSLAFLCAVLMLAPAGWAQSTPQIGNQNEHWYSGITRKYSPSYIPPVDLSNSSRLDQLVRAGNLYLSLQDAIALALENNIDIEVQRYNYDIRNFALKSAEAQACGGNGCDPTFTANMSWARQASIVTNAIVGGGVSTNVGNNRTRNFSIQQGLPTGGTATLNFNNSSGTTNNPNVNFVPNLQSSLNLQMTQPLLSGFGLALNRRPIVIARNDIRRTDFEFQQNVNTVLNTVVQAYWNLVSARSNVDVVQQSLDLAQQLYDNNRKQLEIGTLAALEVLQAETALESARSNLVQAQTAVLTQENAMKNLLSRNGIASPLIADAHIIPTDRIRVPEVEPVTPIQDLIDLALQKRPEIGVQQLNLENQRINLQTTRNSMLPQLNLTGNVNNVGTGGPLNPIPNIDPLTGQLRPRNVNTDLIGGYGNILRQLFGVPTISYNVGFQFTVNLRNRSAQAQMAQQTTQLRTAELQLQRTLNQIRVDVRNAQIAVEQARARYASAEKARAIQEQVLRAEEQKYQLGASTVYTVVQMQRDLANTRQQELAAQVAYAQAKLQLDVATGNLMDRYNIVFDEAREGTIQRRADPIPDVLTPQGQAANPAAPRPLAPR
jgi:outer membrane protein